MRITKVKVKVDGKEQPQTILIHRTNHESRLVAEDTSMPDLTDELLPNGKIESFRLSVQNKTVVKKLPKSATNNIRKDLENLFKTLVKGNLPADLSLYKSLQTASRDDIRKCLGNKFQKPVTYTNAAKEQITFDLVEDIIAARKDRKRLQAYIEWKEDAINQKANLLKKSIKENKLTTDLNAKTEPKSKRKQALNIWTNKYLEGKKCDIDLKCFEGMYKIDELVKKLQDETKPVMTPYIDNKGNKSQKEVPSRYEYHRALKHILNQHRNSIFGKEEYKEHRENVQLNQYQEEVKKYMERNFPLKASKRVLTLEQIPDFLDGKKIKRTIKHQLINAIRRNLIGDGRSQFFDYNSDTTSTDLQKTKIGENFSLKFLDACAFAANNICNVIGYKDENDIINTTPRVGDKKDSFQSIVEKVNMDETFKRLKLFYPNAKVYCEQSLWAMRGSVNRIRHQIVHFKKGTLGAIETTPDFETEIKDRRTCFSETYFKELLKREITKLPTILANKLMTANILTYYSIENLVGLFDHFHLMGSVVPFAPGYGNVYKQGAKYQDHRPGAYNLETEFYKPNTQTYSKDDEASLARYNLLKIVYNHMFLKDFTNNETDFAKAVECVICINERFAKGSKGQAFAFNGMRKMNEGETPTQYMSYVQSAWTQELAKNEDKQANQKANKDSRIHFSNFVLQIFIKGFDTYLSSKECWDFILNPSSQIPQGEDEAKWKKSKSDEISHSLKFKNSSLDKACECSSQIGFYTFCKLLDANHLSTLRNELLKYAQAKQDTPLDHWREMIEMCLLSVDQMPKSYTKIGPDTDKFISRFTPYIEIEKDADLKEWDELFYQSDKETPIVHAPVEIAMKYGTDKILRELMKQYPEFKVKKKEFNEWDKKKDNIEVKMKRREELHTCWLKSKDEHREKDFLNSHKKDYEDSCTDIDHYNWLDNRMHLQHLTRLHNLIIDLLGRMIGFTHFWERDYRMTYANLKEYRNIGKSLDFDGKKALPFVKDTGYEDLYLNLMLDPKRKDNRKTRNYVAHLHYLREQKQGETPRSLIGLINDLRALTEYDRKLKNAVCKSIIKIFDKYGMELKFSVNEKSHLMEVASVTSKKIKHLGGKVTTKHVPELFCEMCKALLTLKKDISHG